MSPYVSYDFGPPTAETRVAPGGATPPVETSTASEVVKAFFRKGPIYTSGPEGLIVRSGVGVFSEVTQ